MKKLIFMRHGYLEGKYGDYCKLSFHELEGLLTKEITPPIDKKRTKAALFSKKFLIEIDRIFCSAESRGIETAQVAQEMMRITFKQSNLLREIDFTKGVIAPEDIGDFNHLRKKILTQFYNSSHSEQFEDAKKRLLQFLEQMKQTEGLVILCITHGWFMRLISIYAHRASLENITLDDLLSAGIPAFLDTIEVTI